MKNEVFSGKIILKCFEPPGIMPSSGKPTFFVCGDSKKSSTDVGFFNPISLVHYDSLPFFLSETVEEPELLVCRLLILKWLNPTTLDCNSANSQIHHKKRKPTLANKTRGMYIRLGEIKEFLPENRPDHPAEASGLSPAVSEFEMMFQPNRRLTRLLLSTFLL